MKLKVVALTYLWHAVFCTSLAVAQTDEPDYELSEEAGVRITASLAAHLERQSTTALRKELKSVVIEKRLDDTLADLANRAAAGVSSEAPIPVITVKDRDKHPEGGRNETFTFYGRGVYFNNQTTKTKIKLRTRFYLQKFDDGKRVVRAPDMQDYAFVELKIKNPSPELAEVVHKHRFKIADADLLRLYHADPASAAFAADMQSIQEAVIAFADQGEQRGLIEAMFEAITEFARLDVNFIRPLTAVSYERTAKKYKIASASARVADDAKPAKVGFQLTVDRKVAAYRPTLDLGSAAFNFGQYFAEAAPQDIVQRYPDDAVAVEVKIPLDLANKRDCEEAELFSYFESIFIAPIFTESALYEGFELNKGKTHYFRQSIGE